jgi:hypothetical protein
MALSSITGERAFLFMPQENCESLAGRNAAWTNKTFLTNTVSLFSHFNVVILVNAVYAILPELPRVTEGAEARNKTLVRGCLRAPPSSRDQHKRSQRQFLQLQRFSDRTATGIGHRGGDNSSE